jgi:hypothetical protein
MRKGEDTVVVLRYAGASIEDALSKTTLTKPGGVLKNLVKVNPDNPTSGTATFNYAVVRSPEGSRTLSLGGGQPPAVVLVRGTPGSSDWDLSGTGRQEVAKLLR